MRAWVLLGLLVCGVGLTSAHQQEAYDRLVKEMRCVTCPNQSVADSYAPIAVAMRDEIRKRLEAGESEDAIREYLISRYGEYITYRPAVQRETWFLWAAPALFLLVGSMVWLNSLRQRNAS
jgi:cytochrome c-type biogenesis protein CcmH